MGDVVELKPSRSTSDKDGPHLSGQAVCVACRHKWEAVAPVGVVHLECPSCRRMWGEFKNPVEPDEAWACHCGNQLFFIKRDQTILCRKCGDLQTGWF